MSLLNHVLGVLTWSLSLRVYMLAGLRGWRACLFKCLCAWRVCVLAFLRALRGCVLACLACSRAWHAFVFACLTYVLAMMCALHAQH